ncbi:MAG: hypothetical protein WC028_18255 [Candidatus Obscuribacterales bacterium]
MGNNELERFMQTIAALERQYGRVPTIREIASELGVKPMQVRSFINKNLVSDKIDGTSVFHASLREELLTPLESSSITRLMPRMENCLGQQQIDADEDAIPSEAQSSIDKMQEDDEQSFEPTHLAEIKLLEGIDDDYHTKLANAAELLLAGSKIQIVVELEEADFERAQSAFALINKFANELGAIAVWNVEPKLKGDAAYLWISSGLSQKYHSQRRHKLNTENTTDE